MTRPTKKSSHSARRRSARGKDSWSRPDNRVRARRDEPAQPLAASWDPETTLRDSGASKGSEQSRTRRHSWIGRYGWRIYAVPLLIVVSVLAVFQTTEQPPSDSAGDSDGRLRAVGEDQSSAPVTEAPPGQAFDPRRFSADLPEGSPIPTTGSGVFDVVPGRSAPAGGGKLHKYTVEIEAGVHLGEGNGTFPRLVQETLSDPRSWTNPRAKPGGIALQRVDASEPAPDFRVTLVSQNTARQVCGYGGGLQYDSSCRVSDQGGQDRVYINAARWVRGAISFNGDLGTYRRYAINHEVGHVFGGGHVGCGQQGALAPVMMQQTFSVSNNELHELNKAVSQGTQIPADGLVCKPNAWPFPVAGG